MIGLNRNTIGEMVKKGNKEDYSHVIICHDKCYDYYFPKYVSYEENVQDVIRKIINNSETEKIFICEIYNYNLDIDEQLKEERPCHVTPIIKKKIIEEKLHSALDFATMMHEGQTRKDGTPYISHPIRVANYVAKYKDSRRLQMLMMCAYLHDTIEDTSATYYDITQNFGSQVAGIVLEVTNDEIKKKELGKEQYLSRKMSTMSSWALVVKLCDRLDNVTDLANANEEFRLRYMNETIGIIVYLINSRELSKAHLAIVNEILNRLEFLNQYYNYHDDRIREVMKQVGKIEEEVNQKEKILLLSQDIY